MDCTQGQNLIRTGTLCTVEQIEPSPPRPLERSLRPLSPSHFCRRRRSQPQEDKELDDVLDCIVFLAASSTADSESSIYTMVLTESDMDECPLCVCPMNVADVHFPLHCPRYNCDFNMCAACIVGMLKSEADEYEIASDGSRQVKFRISCPSCRSKYVAPDPEMELAAEEKKEASTAIANLHKGRHPQQPIVGYVLLLREAYEQIRLQKEPDCDLSAADLQKKHEFIRSTSLSDLKEAMLNYDIYLEKIQKRTCSFRFDWKDFKMLSHTITTAGSRSELRSSRLPSKPWRDPTLFMGLEELMSLEEQEFVTGLMCGNDTNKLAQAACIMHGVLSALGTSRPSAVVVQELSGFGATLSPLPPSTKRVRPPPSLNPKVVQRIKARFPLPAHMPCCFILPVYDPSNERNLPLRFETNLQNIKSDLQLAQVRGIAGRSGLRRGDIITHIHSDPVYNLSQYVEAVSDMYAGNPNDELVIVVNATQATAMALHERAQAMQQAKIYS